MKMDWKIAVIITLALVLSASLLAPVAMANGKGEGKWHGKGGDWRRSEWQGGYWDRDRGWAVNYPVYSNPYPVAYPVAYPVYVPANFGGDQGACYQACVNSGRYSPAQCGQMCYYA